MRFAKMIHIIVHITVTLVYKSLENSLEYTSLTKIGDHILTESFFWNRDQFSIHFFKIRSNNSN